MPSVATLALASLLAVHGACSSLGDAWELEKYIKTERVIALQGVLDNIGPNGVKVPGAGRGIVIASPSKANPDCKGPTKTHQRGKGLIDSLQTSTPGPAMPP